MTKCRHGLIGIFLLLFVLLVWSYLGFYAVLAGTHKFVLVQQGNPERDPSYMENYIQEARVYFIASPAIELTFIAVVFPAPRKPWTRTSS